MKLTASTSLLGLALFAVTLIPASAADPNPDLILRQMSSKIGGAQQFSFTARRQLDAALTDGRKLAVDAQIEVAVLRPGKIIACSTAKHDVRRILADGQHLSMVDLRKNFYATVPMPTSIDGLVERVDEKYGFTPPLAEFVVSNPYNEIRLQAEKVTYLGRSTYRTGFLGLTSVECHRLGLPGKIADAELWVGVKDQLPRRFTATFKDRPGKPQMKAEFSAWNLDSKLSPADFTFTPPKGAMQIQMKTTAEMHTKR